MTPSVSVVVPTKDRPASLGRCLEALAAQRVADLEVVVVDDGSSQADLVAQVVADAPRARLVRSGGRGPAAARNVGADESSGRVLCFTDDDCCPAPSWAEALTAAIGEGCAAAAGPTRNARPQDPYASAAQLVTNSVVERSADTRAATVGFAPTSNLAMAAEVHAQVRFDEDFPAAAGEDRDWCDRLAAAGMSIAYRSEAWVDHHQQLDAATFWRQQVRYGRGSQQFRTARAVAAPGVSYYRDLLRSGFAEGPAVGGLILVSQVATAWGAASERLSGSGRARS